MDDDFWDKVDQSRRNQSKIKQEEDAAGIDTMLECASIADYDNLPFDLTECENILNKLTHFQNRRILENVKHNGLYAFALNTEFSKADRDYISDRIKVVEIRINELNGQDVIYNSPQLKEESKKDNSIISILKNPNDFTKIYPIIEENTEKGEWLGLNVNIKLLAYSLLELGKIKHPYDQKGKIEKYLCKRFVKRIPSGIRKSNDFESKLKIMKSRLK